MRNAEPTLGKLDLSVRTRSVWLRRGWGSTDACVAGSLRERVQVSDFEARVLLRSLVHMNRFQEIGPSMGTVPMITSTSIAGLTLAINRPFSWGPSLARQVGVTGRRHTRNNR